MPVLKIKDGFFGEKQINIPREVVVNKLSKQLFIDSLFITHIGYFPKAKFHYRKRQFGCPDNILIYCVGGRGHYQTATKSYTLNANQFMILPPGKFHIYQADIHNPWSIYWVHFSGHKVKQLNKWMQTEEYEKPTDIDYNKKIIEQWSEMYNALTADYADKNLAFANFCLYRFLTFFICPHQFVQAALPPNPVGESIAYMKANIDKILSVDDLANEFEFSGSHYSSLFRAKTGTSPIDYFIKLKIDYACQLLSQSNLKIKDIATKIGYDDTFYFSRIFKKINGKSPRDYKKSIRLKIGKGL
jgi:AraC-like DNA-binding protein